MAERLGVPPGDRGHSVNTSSILELQQLANMQHIGSYNIYMNNCCNMHNSNFLCLNCNLRILVRLIQEKNDVL